MYALTDSLATVKGIGPATQLQLDKKGLRTVQDLLLWVPLRYEDRSQRATIATAPLNQTITIAASVIRASNYYKGPRSIQSAVIADDTGRLKVMWFNNRFIVDKLKVGQRFLFCGEVNDRGTMMQPVVEAEGGETIHTDRLVPIYSQLPGLKGGSVRRILKQLLDGLDDINDEAIQAGFEGLALTPALHQLHFPDSEELVTQARERLALEELLSLMKHSQEQKAAWSKGKPANPIPKTNPPPQIPFALTKTQVRSIDEILTDLEEKTPMNRLLVGDVGSGKTVVAGTAAWQTIQAGHHTTLIAPTRILAEQHLETLSTLFPDIPVQLVTTQPGKKQVFKLPAQPTFFVGTHALLNKLETIKPALVIYDEQHRFGVKQRSWESTQDYRPHVLTMTATPIPRSLMLTIFSHLSLSVIDELPAGRIPVKTWVTAETKRADAYSWIATQLTTAKTAHQPLQVLIVCPFIDPAQTEALANVAAVNDKVAEVKAALGKVARVGALHGRQTKKEQQSITEQLYSQQLDVLVTTPIVEVGVDLPAASIIVIEGAERFGLASLHQLRGRVGRAGQQGYCLLFRTTTDQETHDNRLEKFANISNGQQLAELDLEHRGAGDLFGTQQHGFDDLKFATWTNADLIFQTRTLFEKLKQKNKLETIWKFAQSNNEKIAAN